MAFEAPSFSGSDSTVQEPTESATVEPQGQEQLNSGNPFLNEVAAQHREIVAPYLKKWDAESTKKFQEYSSKLKPYEELGSPDDLRKAYAVAQMMRQDPEGFFRRMWENLQNHYGDSFDTELLRILQLQEAMEEGNMDAYDSQSYEGGEPDPNEVFQQNVVSELEELRSFKESFEEQQRSAEEEKQLASFLEAMHTKYGDFDDDYVLLQLSRHGDVQKAMNAYNAFTQKVSQGNPPRQPPKTMSAAGQGGGIPNQQVDVSKLRGRERRDMVAAMLERGA